MRKFSVVSFMLITLFIIGNSSDTKSEDEKNNCAGTKSSESTGSIDSGCPRSSKNDASKNSDEHDSQKAIDADIVSEIEKSEELKEAMNEMNTVDMEVAEVDEVPHKCDHDHNHCKPDKPCPQSNEPTTSVKDEKNSIGFSPKPRIIADGQGIAFKYEVDFKKPIFNLKGFRGGLAAGYIKEKSTVKDSNRNRDIKLFLSGEFGFITKDNTTLGVTGEVFLEVKLRSGEFSIGAGVKIAVLGKTIVTKDASIGNKMEESPPICVRIPQLAGIIFCQVAFDFIFRTNFTGSACIQTEIKHLACPIPLVTIQYHCLNFSGKRFYWTKSTRKSGFINPKEIGTSFLKRIPSLKNDRGKETQPPSSTKSNKQAPMSDTSSKKT